MTVIIAIYLSVFTLVLIRALYRYKAHNEHTALRPLLFWVLGLLALGIGAQLLESPIPVLMFIVGFVAAYLIDSKRIARRMSSKWKFVARGLAYAFFISPTWEIRYSSSPIPAYVRLLGNLLGILDAPLRETEMIGSLLATLVQFSIAVVACCLIFYFGERFWRRRFETGNEHNLVDRGDSDGLFLELEEYGGSPHATDAQSRTPMHLAAQKGDVGILTLLIKRGAHVLARDSEGNTPLHCAGTSGAVEFLLANGARLNVVNHKSATALHVAADHSVVEALVKGGLSPDVPDQSKMTPVHSAARDGRADALQALIEHGADAQAVSVRGQQPLHLAAEKGHSECVDILLNAGADPNAQDDMLHFSALHRAVSFGHSEIASRLLIKGADPDLKTRAGDSARDIAQSSSDPRMIEVLGTG